MAPETTGTSPRGVAAAAATDVGHVRRRNEDHAVVASTLVTGERGEHAAVVEPPAMVAVLDGMGGHPAGDVASRLVAEALVGADLPVERGDVDALVAELQGRLARHMQDHPETIGMGTTLAAASLLDRATALVIGIGDSAALWWDGELADTVPRDRGAGGWITQVLGGMMDDHVDAHLLELSGPGRLLLATDGLTDAVAPDVVAACLADHDEPAASARALVEVALADGGHDNVTVVVADLAAPEAG